jgi:hypothetical protein
MRAHTCQHVAVGKAKERVRVAKAAQIAKAGTGLWMQRVAQIHHYRAPCSMVIGE